MNRSWHVCLALMRPSGSATDNYSCDTDLHHYWAALLLFLLPLVLLPGHEQWVDSITGVLHSDPELPWHFQTHSVSEDWYITRAFLPICTDKWQFLIALHHYLIRMAHVEIVSNSSDSDVAVAFALVQLKSGSITTVQQFPLWSRRTQMECNCLSGKTSEFSDFRKVITCPFAVLIAHLVYCVARKLRPTCSACLCHYLYVLCQRMYSYYGMHPQWWIQDFQDGGRQP